MKKGFFVLILAVGAISVHAAVWRGLTDANWYSGPKVTEKDLAGKVVLVDKWGVHCPPCRALLPKAQKIWDSFKNKNFVLIGSHCQGRSNAEVAKLVKDNNLTFPIYEMAGLAENEPRGRGIPFLYVVNHRGKVVYSGHNANEAITAVTDAIVAINLPPSLTASIDLGDNPAYKPLLKQIVLGKNVTPFIKRLQSEIAKGEKRMASQAQKDNALAAKTIIDGIEAAKGDILAEIELKKTTNPEEALKYLQLFMKSFPKESAELKAQIPELKKAIKTWKIEQKEKKAQEKKKAK